MEDHEEGVIWIPSLRDFYLSPYLTCKECNGISFVDSHHVQNALVVKTSWDDQEQNGLALEALPCCPICRRTHTWAVGALDLSDLIVGNIKQRRFQRVVENRCAIKLQAIARGIRDRKRANEVRIQKKKHEAFVFYCASRLAAFYKGRLDRRAASTERNLHRIRNAHPTIMAEALMPRMGVKVFWYRRKQEIDLLYKDYRLLVQRTGNDPPLHMVERNFSLISENIHRIECERAAKIQKRVRGMIGRKSIRQYRREHSFIMAKQCAAVFQIQRCFRGWIHRKIAWKLALEQRKQKLKHDLKRELSQKKKHDALNRLHNDLKLYYLVERREELTARMTGRVMYSSNKMKTFAESPYGLHKVDETAKKLIKFHAAEQALYAEKNAKAIQRRDFIESKREESKFYNHYFHHEKQQRRSNFMEELSRYRRFIRPGSRVPP